MVKIAQMGTDHRTQIGTEGFTLTELVVASSLAFLVIYGATNVDIFRLRLDKEARSRFQSLSLQPALDRITQQFLNGFGIRIDPKFHFDPDQSCDPTLPCELLIWYLPIPPDPPTPDGFDTSHRLAGLRLEGTALVLYPDITDISAIPDNLGPREVLATNIVELTFGLRDAEDPDGNGIPDGNGVWDNLVTINLLVTEGGPGRPISLEVFLRGMALQPPA